MENVKNPSLKSGLIYNGVYQVLSALVPLITSPYIARVLAVDGYGLFNYTVSVSYYFFIFGMLGVNTYGNREIAKVRDNPSKRSTVFWQIYYLQLILGLLVTILYFVFVSCFIIENRFFFYLQGLYVISVCTDINWYAFGLEEFRLITIRSLCVLIIKTILIFVLVKSKNDLVLYFLIYVFGVLFGLFPIWPLVFKTTTIERPSFKKMRAHLRPNLILFLPVIASSVYGRMDKVMIGAMISDSEVGYYNYAENIISIPMGLMTTVSNVMLPRSSYLISNGLEEKSCYLYKTTLKYTGILNIALSFGIIGVADLFIPWYLGESYSYTSFLLKLLAPIIFLSGISTVVREQLLIPNNMEKQYSTAIIIGSVVNLVANFYFIRKLGAVGGCITTVLAFLIVMLLQLFYARKKATVLRDILSLFPFILVGIVMLIIIEEMKVVLSSLSVFLLMAIVILAGGLFYLVSSFLILKWLQSDSFIDELVRRLLGRTNRQ